LMPFGHFILISPLVWLVAIELRPFHYFSLAKLTPVLPPTLLPCVPEKG
jgi:hypothetical protein